MSLYIGENKMNLHIGETKVKLNALNWDYIISDGKLVLANPNLYLFSSGTQYINTTFLYKTTSSIEICSSSFNDGSLFGFYTENGQVAFAAADNIMYYRIYAGVGTSVGSSGTKRIYKLKSNIGYIDGVKVVTGGTAVDSKLTTYLFARNINNSPQVHGYGKINWCKIYDNDAIVHNFVPVPTGLQIGDYTVPSNGMWDIVTQQFFGNSGTGKFSYGRDE